MVESDSELMSIYYSNTFLYGGYWPDRLDVVPAVQNKFYEVSWESIRTVNFVGTFSRCGFLKKLSEQTFFHAILPTAQVSRG